MRTLACWCKKNKSKILKQLELGVPSQHRLIHFVIIQKYKGYFSITEILSTACQVNNMPDKVKMSCVMS